MVKNDILIRSVGKILPVVELTRTVYLQDIC